MEYSHTSIKISTNLITEEAFKFRMSKVPEFFEIKMNEDKLFIYGLALYISEEDAAKIGFQKLVNITNEFKEVFELNTCG